MPACGCGRVRLRLRGSLRSEGRAAPGLTQTAGRTLKPLPLEAGAVTVGRQPAASSADTVRGPRLPLRLTEAQLAPRTVRGAGAQARAPCVTQGPAASGLHASRSELCPPAPFSACAAVCISATTASRLPGGGGQRGAALLTGLCERRGRLGGRGRWGGQTPPWRCL